MVQNSLAPAGHLEHTFGERPIFIWQRVNLSPLIFLNQPYEVAMILFYFKLSLKRTQFIIIVNIENSCLLFCDPHSIPGVPMNLEHSGHTSFPLYAYGLPFLNEGGG